MNFVADKTNPKHVEVVKKVFEGFIKIEQELTPPFTNGTLLQRVVDTFWPDATEEQEMLLHFVMGEATRRAEMRVMDKIIADALSNLKPKKTETPHDVS